MTHPLHDKKMYGTATVGTKGQIVIPSDAREELGIEPGDKLYIAGSSSKKVLFCLKEEQFNEMVEKLTNGVTAANDFINKAKAQKEE